MIGLFKKTSIAKSLINKSLAAYHDNVIEYFERPRNVGSYDKKDKNVGTGNTNAFRILMP